MLGTDNAERLVALLRLLAAAQAPRDGSPPRKLCRVRNATLQTALTVLVGDGRVLKDRAGYALAP